VTLRRTESPSDQCLAIGDGCQPELEHLHRQ
jgi:hypothetical protein